MRKKSSVTCGSLDSLFERRTNCNYFHEQTKLTAAERDKSK